MGDSTSCLLIRGKSAGEIHRELGLRETQPRKAPILGASLAGGWYLLMGPWDFVEGISLAKLSRGAELVSLFVEDHVMASSASQWQDGVRIWHIEHNSEQGRLHVLVEGKAPSMYERIRDEQLALQQSSGGEESNIDYIYDIPRKLAKAVTGFDYDGDDKGVRYATLGFAKRWGFFKAGRV